MFRYIDFIFISFDLSIELKDELMLISLSWAFTYKTKVLKILIKKNLNFHYQKISPDESEKYQHALRMRFNSVWATCIVLHNSLLFRYPV